MLDIVMTNSSSRQCFESDACSLQTRWGVFPICKCTCILLLLDVFWKLWMTTISCKMIKVTLPALPCTCTCMQVRVKLTSHSAIHWKPLQLVTTQTIINHLTSIYICILYFIRVPILWFYIHCGDSWTLYNTVKYFLQKPFGLRWRYS